mmetsp:Transcript_19796/g.29746  ORF Transcript_19796/g.29746 Transcript_19796/m.29746 type:complete len:321 (-) Transcript_19796:1536-2498(-)
MVKVLLSKSKVLIFCFFIIAELLLCKASRQDLSLFLPPPKLIQQQVLVLRGGARHDDEDANLSRRRKMPPSYARKYPSKGPEKPYQRRDNAYYNKRAASSRRRAPSALNTAASLAKKTIDVTSAAAWTTLKGSGKAAFYLAAPKHVERREMVGVWRLDQSVGDKFSTVCAANVEFTTKGDVMVKYDDQTFITPFLFRERKWPQSCTVEFEARAFQGPHDEKPVLMRYKGYFRRKLADSNVIKIVGDIYAVSKTGWRRGDGKRIGSFVARRRLLKRRQNDESATEDEFEEDFDSNMEDYTDDEENSDVYDGGISDDEYDDY